MGWIMQLFIKKVSLFLMLFLITVAAFYGFDYCVIGNQYNQIYDASLIDKVERLEAIREPKIMIVGDSNVCFGIKSQMIEEQFGMPVVDLGLHGSLGNAFHENITKLNIGAGDIVIVCHSNYNDQDVIVDPDLACITLEWNTELWKILRPKDVFTVLKASPNYVVDSMILWLKGEGNLPRDDCYTRSAFNKYGDIGYERQKSVYTFTEGVISVPQINDICAKRLNEFNQFVTEHGAMLLIAGYPVGDGEYTPARSEFQEFQIQLENKLDAEVISDWDDYFFPYDYFYNTQLHLTDKGAEVRTEQLIRDLKKYFISHG